MGDFYRYYKGDKVAPVLTIFIGGNHEASNHLLELVWWFGGLPNSPLQYYGGWAAPNIYFLGHSGCVNYRGLRIAGVSGIFKGYDFRRGYEERVPLNENHLRSVYHQREFEMKKLAALSCQGRPRAVDIAFSHDWPTGVWKDVSPSVLRRRLKFHIADQILQGGSSGRRGRPHRGRGRGRDRGSGLLGSPPLTQFVLSQLRPRFFFSGHMHQKFSCEYCHPPDDDIEDDILALTPSLSIPGIARDVVKTHFLALSKPLPGRDDFLDVVEVSLPKCPSDEYAPNELYYDKEWLAIVRASNPFLSLTRKCVHAFPSPAEFRELVEREMGVVERRIREYQNGKYASLRIPKENFVRNPRKNYEGDGQFFVVPSPRSVDNPQRAEFCALLELEDLIRLMEIDASPRVVKTPLETNVEEVDV